MGCSELEACLTWVSHDDGAEQAKKRDGNEWSVALTASGQASLAASWPFWIKAQEHFLYDVGFQYWPMLLGDLRQFSVSP